MLLGKEPLSGRSWAKLRRERGVPLWVRGDTPDRGKEEKKQKEEERELEEKINF